MLAQDLLRQQNQKPAASKLGIKYNPLDIQAQLAEKRLKHFIKQAWPWIDPAPYSHNWHIDAVADHLEAVSRGKIRNLIINIPPRHMKSLMMVMWRAWCWAQPQGRGPNMGPQTRFINASYIDDLSVRDNLTMRNLIYSPWYQRNWGHRVKLSESQNSKDLFYTKAGGFSMATSIDGKGTGEGGNVICIDDPHNVAGAESDTVRTKALRWFDETIQSRLNQQTTGAFVIVMQRLHESDLSGHVLAKETEFDHLCIPAEFEVDHPTPIRSSIGFKDPRKRDGELLWPERFDGAVNDRLQKSLGSYAAAGQYQQRPSPRSGGLFQREWFEIVRAAPAGGKECRGWDLAASTDANAAYTVGVKLRRVNGVVYIVDVIRFRGSFERVESGIKSAAVSDGVACKVSMPQDPGQAGKVQAKYLVKMLTGYNARTSPESGDKVTRAEPVSAQAEAGNIKIVKADWNEPFLAELTGFPNGRYKDQVDALSRAFHDLGEDIPAVGPVGGRKISMFEGLR